MNTSVLKINDMNQFKQYITERIADWNDDAISKEIQRNLSDTNQDYFHTGIILNDGNEYVAHAVIYDNPHFSLKGERTLLAGNFYVRNDASLAEELVTTVIEEAKQLCAQHLMGPINGSTWNNYRFITENNYPFFGNLKEESALRDAFIRQGFEPLANYYSRLDDDLSAPANTMQQRKEVLMTSGLTIRPIDKTNFEKELESLYDFSLRAFEKNFLYSPISKEIFFDKYKEILPIINPEFVLIAENKNSKMVGFVFCYDNFGSNRKELIVKTIARDPSKEWSGLGGVLAEIVVQKAKDLAYKAIIHAFLIDEGTSTPLSNKFSGKIISRYTLYQLDVK